MEPEYEIVTKEIPAKGKGYILVRKCWPDQMEATLRKAARQLLGQGACALYATSMDPGAPLAEGTFDAFRLEYRHDMLTMERPLSSRPVPEGRLTLEPLRREWGGAWLTMYQAAFFDVPNSKTYDRVELERILGPDHCCGFAVLDGVRVGIYECCVRPPMPEICAVGLAKDYRGKGLGRELLACVMELLAQLGQEKAGLTVSSGNAPAFALYRKVGFRAARTLSRWYELMAEGDLLD